MLSKHEDFIDIYLKRLEEQRLMEEKIKQLESKMVPDGNSTYLPVQCN